MSSEFGASLVFWDAHPKGRQAINRARHSFFMISVMVRFRLSSVLPNHPSRNGREDLKASRAFQWPPLYLPRLLEKQHRTLDKEVQYHGN